jgi:competence protein ComEC
MRIFAVSFVLGALLLQHEAALPQWRIAWAGCAATLAIALLPVRMRGARAVMAVIAGCLVGYGWAAWRAETRLADALPLAWEGRDIAVVGVVAGLAQESDRGVRFLLDVEAVATPGAVVPQRIALTWYPERARGAEPVPPPALRAAERWRFTVRLKRPRGLANPHGFDFEPWALERGIRATGYVRSRDAFRRVEERADGFLYAIDRWRDEVRAAMRSHLGDARLAGVLVALAIGDQDAIAADDWEVFWRTGVGHLMSISGLHITMLAGLAFVAAFALWARVPSLALAWPARKAAIVVGTLVALAYSLMTGFAVPAQRTFVMLAAIAACVLADRHGSPSRVLAIAALAVLTADPWAVLSAGFWLSFGAVAAIFYVVSLRTGRPGRLQATVMEQVAVTLVMVPMLVALFQEVSLVPPSRMPLRSRS